MNIVSVSWGDHLAFGEGDGRLAIPDAVARRMRAWHDELDASRAHWRIFRPRVPGTFFTAPGRQHPSQASRVDWNEMGVVPDLARAAGLASVLYVSVFDEGWPLAPPAVREISHHNAMHGKDVAWQSRFSVDHPEYIEVDRNGVRQHGVLSMAFPAVRAHFIERFTTWLQESSFSGLFVCLRSQSKPAAHGDQFGFTEPVRGEYQQRHGRDILHEDFDLQGWRDLRGEYLTRFLRELREALRKMDRRLSVGVPRGDVIGPPLGNMTIDWRAWVREGLIDTLVINQNSSRCPSMWHDLWPMHRGTGYLQHYLTGEGLPPLVDHLRDVYTPVVHDRGVQLFVARQWDARDADTERAIAAIPGVTGLVFSSFRHDNPRAVARGDWRF